MKFASKTLAAALIAGAAALPYQTASAWGTDWNSFGWGPFNFSEWGAGTRGGYGAPYGYGSPYAYGAPAPYAYGAPAPYAYGAPYAPYVYGAPAAARPAPAAPQK